MTEQNYLVINTSTNVCENSVVWNGDESVWAVPADCIAIPQATTPAKIWQRNQNGQWLLVEQMGAGGIGFTWDGSCLTTDQAQPTESDATTP